MTIDRFDHLTRAIGTRLSRRRALAGIGGVGLWGLAAGRLRPVDAKRKRCRNGKKKCGKKCVNLQTNERHCGTCRTKCDAGEFCLDGECLVKLGTCEVGDNFCLNGVDVCNDNDTCQCHQSMTGQTRCASFPTPPFTCGQCVSDAECAAFGPGAFCARTTSENNCVCEIGQGFCLIPCKFRVSDV